MENNKNNHHPLKPWQEELHRIIFGTESWSGRIFDIALLYAILISILAVMLESVEDIPGSALSEGMSWIMAMSVAGSVATRRAGISSRLESVQINWVACPATW